MLAFIPTAKIVSLLHVHLHYSLLLINDTCGADVKRRQLFLDFNGKASGPNDVSPGAPNNVSNIAQNNVIGNGSSSSIETSPPQSLSLPPRPPSLPLSQQNSSVNNFANRPVWRNDFYIVRWTIIQRKGTFVYVVSASLADDVLTSFDKTMSSTSSCHVNSWFWIF